MRRLTVLAAVLLVAGCGGPTVAGGRHSSASCVAPQLTVTPMTVAPGDPLLVRGEYFFDTCQDTVANGVTSPPPRPLTDLTVLLRQGDRSWTLAEQVDAGGPSWTFDRTAAVPIDVSAGDAVVLVAGYGQPVPVTVRQAVAQGRSGPAGGDILRLSAGPLRPVSWRQP